MDRKKKLRLIQMSLLLVGSLIVFFTYLQKNKKSEEFNQPKLNIKRNKDDIPPGTLKLIEESEKNIKN